MGILIRKQKGMNVFTGIAKLAVAGFIVSLASSFVDTIWAVYIDSFVHSEAIVGFISSFLTLISFASYFILIPFVEKTNKSKIYLYSLISFAVAYILFAINTNFVFFLIIAFGATIIVTLRVTSFGIIIRDKSHEKQLSRNEGLVYTFMNVAWLLGPLLAGYISSAFGVNIIFILAAIFLIVAAFFFKISKIRDANIKKNPDHNLLKNFKSFFKNKQLRLVYIIGGGINLWWILIYLFIPLHILREGLSMIWIGFFLSAVTIPLILFEFKFAKLAGKIGFKKIFIIGFLIPAIASLLCFFILNIYFVMATLVLASLGLAMLEPTTEAYFFDTVKKKDEAKFYGPYNTTGDVNAFIGKILSATILIFLPFRFVFLLFAALMGIFVFLSSRIKDVIEARK